MKIGLIQSEAVAGDLSRNLRRVVQGYRQCLDEGAELVIAPAHALDGAFLQDLAERSSFRLQARAALHALASETSLPMLIASCAGMPGEPSGARPWLLQSGEVTPLQEHSPVAIGNRRFSIHLAPPTPTPTADTGNCDYVLHMPGAPWWHGQEQEWQQLAEQEARHTGAHILLLRSVAHTEGQLAPGGSFACSPEGGATTLPTLEPAARVWQAGKSRLQQPPAHTPLLGVACYALRSMLEQSGYAGLAIDTAAPQAALLLALSRAAVGARRTIALSTAPATERNPLAGKQMQLHPTGAEEHDLLLLNSCTLSQRILGATPAPAALAGMFAPLGELYDSECALLREQLLATLPQPLRAQLPPLPGLMPPAQETELRLLIEDNAAVAEILSRYPQANEARLRKMLRRLNATPRYGQPCSLRVRRRIVHLPAYHRHSE